MNTWTLRLINQAILYINNCNNNILLHRMFAYYAYFLSTQLLNNVNIILRSP